MCVSRKDDEPEDDLGLQELSRGMKDRQKGWLNRESAPWRPIKLHSLVACAWCKNVHYSFQIGTGHARHSFFDPKDYTVAAVTLVGVFPLLVPRHFRQDAEVFERLKNTDLVRRGQKLLRRHLLTKVPSAQLLRALGVPAAGGAHWLACIRRVLRAWASVAVPSKVIEDVVGSMKTSWFPSRRSRPLGLSTRTLGIVSAQVSLQLLLPHQQLPADPSHRQTRSMPN